MSDTAPELPTPDANPTKRKKGKVPRSSRDFGKVIDPLVIKATLDGDHRTCKCRLPNGRVDNITIIEGVHDLKDSNPKVWYKLVKTLKTWGVIALAAGSATLIASQLNNFLR